MAGDTHDAVIIDGLQVRRGGRMVLDGLSLHIPAGQVIGLLGPSGCGKTTLMRSIVGVQRVRGGTVRVLGESAGAVGLRHRVAYGTQDAAVYGDLTVRENLRYFAAVLGVPSADVDRVIDEVGLTEQAGRAVDALSGGQVNRVSLGIALLGSPELVVLDEPTVGLDPVLRVELWELFRRIASGGTTMLVSSHVMDEALRCDRLLLMRGGRIIADTTPQQLRDETGESDPEAAFLAIIERDLAAARQADDGHPETRRERRLRQQGEEDA